MSEPDLVELAWAVVVIVAKLDRAEPWRADALCLEHPELNWFPARGEPLTEQRAICGRCLVVRECREYAAAHPGLDGLWGGTSGRERRTARTGNPSVAKPKPKRRRCAGCGGGLPHGREKDRCVACEERVSVTPS